MRKLNVSTLVTLDGVIQDPGGFGELDQGGWGSRYFDDEARSYALEHLRESDPPSAGVSPSRGAADRAGTDRRARPRERTSR
jgi:hypothetical protein